MIFLAGCIIGVEGYTESAASGGLAGINASRVLANLPLVTPPFATAHGSLVNYITTSDPRYFQPINTNFGLFPPLPNKIRDKKEKHRLIHHRAMDEFQSWKMQYKIS